MSKLKRRILFIVLLLSFCGLVFAESNSLYIKKLDWFATESANKAPLPEDLTDREIEIYRAGYANGHYDAFHPAFEEGLFVINTKTKKFHLSNCMTTLMIDTVNREHSYETPEELIDKGYTPCKQCNPDSHH